MEFLAADQTADTTDVGVKHEQIGTVALAPEQTLAECRLELAVTPDELAVATDEKERVVDGLHLGARVEFVTANRNINVGFARRLTEAICVVAGDEKCRLAEAHARVDPGRYLKSQPSLQKGYPLTQTSGKTTRAASFCAASRMTAHARAMVFFRSRKADGTCATAILTDRARQARVSDVTLSSTTSGDGVAER